MKSRIVAAVVALLLIVPAATAYGAEPSSNNQEVNVHVLTGDTLGVWVDQIDFGGLVEGQSRRNDFWINILNTSASGWEVTITAGDLYSFDWGGCGPEGCYDPIPTDPMYTISKSNLVIQPGDLDWWDGQDPTGDAIRPFQGSPGDVGSPTTILQGTSYANGEFGLDNPMSWIELTIPGGTQPNLQYRTDVTYTIMAWTP
jgi:hypothetical protein